MTDSFEEINFLIRSENRVTLLKPLIKEAFTERKLIERTDISKVMLFFVWIRGVDL